MDFCLSRRVIFFISSYFSQANGAPSYISKPHSNLQAPPVHNLLCIPKPLPSLLSTCPHHAGTQLFQFTADCPPPHSPTPPPHTHSLRSSFCSQGKALASFCYQVKALAVSSLLLSLSLRGNHGSFGLPQKPLAILFHIHNKHFLSHTHGVVSVCPCLHPPPWALNQLVHTLPQKFWHLHLTYYRNHHMQL